MKPMRIPAAGRDRDALLATELFSYKWRKAASGCRFLAPPQEAADWTPAVGDEQMCRDALRLVPTFSTSADGCSQVKHRMRELGWMLVNELPPVRTGLARAVYYHPVDVGTPDPLYQHWGDTEEDAVTAAALKAIGEERTGFPGVNP